MEPTDFQLASGSVIGRDHRLVNRNCQDGVYVIDSGPRRVAVITDGCGSGRHSEVGAKLGAQMLAESIYQASGYHTDLWVNWQRVRMHVLSNLDVLARQMGGNYRRTVEEFFLFTVVGVVMAGDKAAFFALGDGVIAINGEVVDLGPFPGNAPPYLGYGLIGDSLQDRSLGDQPFTIIRQLPLAELEHFLIGTDGVIDLIAQAGHNQPGSTQPVGGIEQFWTQDSMFANPELVSRRLKLIARDWPRHNPEPGRLPDDTTIVVGRRVPRPTEEVADGYSVRT